MRNRVLIIFLAAVLIGALASKAGVGAQTAQRIFGTLNGAAKAILVDSDGKVRVTGS